MNYVGTHNNEFDGVNQICVKEDTKRSNFPLGHDNLHLL